MNAEGKGQPLSVRWRRQASAFALPVGIAAVLVCLWFGGAPIVEALRYERAAIASGEAWRLVTGNLVHASGQHLVLNLAGLCLVALLFPGEYSRREWSLVATASALAIAVGLWWGSPEVEWYVGLSGVLHGILAAGAFGWWRSRLRGMAVLLWVILVAKLAREQLFGALGWSGDLNVIVDAHLYGAIGGALAGALFTFAGRSPSAATGVPPGASGPV